MSAHTKTTIGCTGWTPGRYQSGDCRRCWKQQNPATEKPVLIPSAIPRSTPEDRIDNRHLQRQGDCVHLGVVTSRTDIDGKERICVGCWLNVCDVHGQCRINYQCQRCDDYIGNRQIIHPSISIAEMIERVKEGHRVWPRNWHKWNVTQRTMLTMMRSFVAAMEPPPPMSGRGIVMCGGGRYEASAYVSIKMIRRTGCTLPIQLWHRGAEEPVGARVRALPGVTVINGLESRPKPRIYGGWESKALAVLRSGFKEVMFLDADCYPVTDPTICFDHNPCGTVFFYDNEPMDVNLQYPSYGITSEQVKRIPGINSGQYIVDLERAWKGMALANWFDHHSDYWYQFRQGVGGFSDQDQLRAAWLVLGLPAHSYQPRCTYEPGVLSYSGPESPQTMFVHRVGCKFAERGCFRRPPRVVNGMAGEQDAWQFWREWLGSAEPQAG
jgi:hypothetical protein